VIGEEGFAKELLEGETGRWIRGYVRYRLHRPGRVADPHDVESLIDDAVVVLLRQAKRGVIKGVSKDLLTRLRDTDMPRVLKAVWPYFFTILWNACTKYNRSNVRPTAGQPFLHEDFMPSASTAHNNTPLAIAITHERARLVQKCLNELSDVDRQVLELKYSFSLTAVQIAEQLGVRLDAAKGRLYRAHLAFKRLFRKYSDSQ